MYKEKIFHQYTSAILIDNRDIIFFLKKTNSGTKRVKHYVTHPIRMHPNRNPMSYIFNTSTKGSVVAVIQPISKQIGTMHMRIQ